MSEATDPRPSHDFVIPTEHVDEVKKLVRERIPDCLIGTRDLGEGKTYFSVTVFSRSPQAIAVLDEVFERFRDKADLSGERPRETPMAELIERVRQARQDS